MTKQFWTEQEIEQLKQLAPTHTNKQIAKIMGRSPISVRSKAWKLVIGIGEYNTWTDDDIFKLYELAGEYPVEIIAKKLKHKHSVHSISTKAYELGLSLVLEYNNWSCQYLAKQLGICHSKLWRAINSKQLKANRIKHKYQITRSQFAAFYKKHKDSELRKNANLDFLK